MISDRLNSIWNVIGFKEDTGDDRDDRVVRDPITSTFQPRQTSYCQFWVGPRRGQASFRRVRNDETGLREGVSEIP